MNLESSCYPFNLFVVNIAVACFDSFLAFIAFYQLTRIHLRAKHVVWNRQKVLHLLIGSSNLGNFIYFITTLVATCKMWFCWSHSCGFILMAFPNILFVAAFLLVLSFWVDLCHQENDEEDDDEQNNAQEALLENLKSKQGLSKTDGHRKCCSFQGIHVGSRQKIVILVVVLVFILTMSFAVLIWIGAGKNQDSSRVVQVYVVFFAATILILGGALGCYGLMLFLKLRKVQSEKAASEMRKVTGLAVVSVVCFSLRALVAFLTDIPLFYHRNLKKTDDIKASVFLILYYFIGSSVPSAFVLWLMRELPPPTAINSQEQSRTISFVRHDVGGTHHWATATTLQNQVSRASPI
ncbi:DUF1084 domain-containing protein [Cephalotus follicularis]|uniref:DUF1084 domain-containing protein n=1 Tax=Cephalotus follicularis TaxID=3775 RepID=A0A1Q3CG93_CEPFO|nr:DUF1084 domain-containing protein [Cephalotus follicularis]